MSLTFGDVIRQWRDIRRFSQLALSAESGISSRHISFLETGRSKPSRGSVMTLARVLEMPKPAVNEALRAAGFAPEYQALPLDDAALAPAMNAIMTILENHTPMPAIVMDAGWNIVGGNAPAQYMMQFLPFHGSLNIVDALLNDDPETPCFPNWTEIATWTWLRLQTEIAREGGDSPLVPLHARLSKDARLQGVDMTSLAELGPVLTTNLRIDGQALSLFTMLAEFSTVQDLNMSERRVELFFAADEATKLFFESIQKH